MSVFFFRCRALSAIPIQILWPPWCHSPAHFGFRSRFSSFCFVCVASFVSAYTCAVIVPLYVYIYVRPVRRCLQVPLGIWSFFVGQLAVYGTHIIYNMFALYAFNINHRNTLCVSIAMCIIRKDTKKPHRGLKRSNTRRRRRNNASFPRVSDTYYIFFNKRTRSSTRRWRVRRLHASTSYYNIVYLWRI